MRLKTRPGLYPGRFEKSVSSMSGTGIQERFSMMKCSSK